MRKDELPDATPEFWERVAVARAVAGYSESNWSIDCGMNQDYFRQLRRRRKRPIGSDLDVLCMATGCTVAFLDNPKPFDLSK